MYIQKKVIVRGKDASRSIIMGIDPGATRVGIGIVEKNRGRFSLRHAALLAPEEKLKGNEGVRLLCIERELKKTLKKYRPDIVGVERLFFSKNQKTAFSVAHARGVVLKTIAETKTTLIELTPNQIKLATTGNGNAPKEAVAKMVGIILHTETKTMVDDITDALAIAIAVSFFVSQNNR